MNVEKEREMTCVGGGVIVGRDSTVVTMTTSTATSTTTSTATIVVSEVVTSLSLATVVVWVVVVLVIPVVTSTKALGEGSADVWGFEVVLFDVFILWVKVDLFDCHVFYHESKLFYLTDLFFTTCKICITCIPSQTWFWLLKPTVLYLHVYKLIDCVSKLTTTSKWRHQCVLLPVWFPVGVFPSNTIHPAGNVLVTLRQDLH